MADKKIPMRMCIACRQMKEKRELVRVVKTADGLKVDKTGKLSGRGAYICSNEECVKKLFKQKLLNKAFSMEVPDDVYVSLEEALLDKE